MNLVKLPLALVYGMVTGIRGRLYDWGILRAYKSSLRVISVGNITAGGNGKTPLCLFLANSLAQRGYRPVVVSRGYGGRIRGPHMVSPTDSPGDVGDEPALLAKEGCAVCVSRSRVAGVQMLEQLGGFDLVILDDGLQHRALERDINLVSIFGGSEKAIVEFVRGALLPVGMFREKRRRALARASLVVVSHRRICLPGEAVPTIDPRITRLLPQHLPVYGSHLEPVGIFPLGGGAQVKHERMVVCTAIANPEGFLTSLERLSVSVVGSEIFPDHHEFTEEELRNILCRYPEHSFVCTAKDAVKIVRFGPEIAGRFFVLDVRATVVPTGEFFAHIERLLGSRSFLKR